MPLFFYCIRIRLLGVISKTLRPLLPRGGVAAAFMGWVALLLVTHPPALWFRRVKLRSRNYIIQMV